MYAGDPVATAPIAASAAVGAPIIPEVTFETTQLVYVVEITVVQKMDG